MDLNELERIINEREIEKKTLEQTIARLQEINKMPFHIKLQQPENKEWLKGFEERQKQAFLTHSVKKWSVPIDQGLELFQEFFTEFLKGEVDCIAEFLDKKGYKPKEWSEIKRKGFY